MIHSKNTRVHTDRFGWIVTEATLKSARNVAPPSASRNGMEKRIRLVRTTLLHLPLIKNIISTRTRMTMPQLYNDISRKLNKVLRHQTGKAKLVGHSGRHHDILPCNEGGWVNINDVLTHGHISNDNSNRIIRDAERGGYLEEILTTRCRRCCQAMWYSRKLQSRVSDSRLPQSAYLLMTLQMKNKEHIGRRTMAGRMT